MDSYNNSVPRQLIVAPWFQTYSLFICFSVLFLSFWGIPANALSILIFLRPNFRHLSINILLLALSIADFLLLIIAMPIFIPHAAVEYLGGAYTAYRVHVLAATYLYPVSTMFHCGSVWLLVVITFERWLAVSRPLAVGYYCTRKRAGLAIGVVSLLAVTYNVIRFWEYRIWTDGSGVMRIEFLLVLNEEYRLWYVTIASQVVIYVIPLIILITFNFLINGELKRALSARSTMMNSALTSDRRTTKMMSAVVMVFICCYSMSLLVQLIERFASKRLPPNIGDALSDLNNLLVMTSAAMTSLLYLKFSTRYRSAAKVILYRILCHEVPNYRSRMDSIADTEYIVRYGSCASIANSQFSCRSSLIPMTEISRQKRYLSPPETQIRRHSSDCEKASNIRMTLQLSRRRSKTYGSALLTASVHCEIAEV